MNAQQAASVLGINSPETGDFFQEWERVVAAYRAAVKRYHPDVARDLDPGFALEMTKMVNLAFEFLEKNWTKIDLKSLRHDLDIPAEIMAVYQKIRHIPGINIHLVGIWLWVEITTPPEYADHPTDTPKDMRRKAIGLREYRQAISGSLKDQGFQFSGKHKKWSWHPTSYQVNPYYKKKQGAWDWQFIVNRFGDDELATQPLRAVA